MRLCILISVVSVVTAYGSAQPELGFDPQAVARQVQAGRDMPGLQPGDHGRIRGRPASRFPEFAELGVEQFPDNGEFLLDTNNAMVPAPGSQTEAAVGYDGTNFLVVWQDLRGGNYSDICGARVTPDGTVLDPRGFVITQAAYEQRFPALAFDGTNFFVVWDDSRRGHSYDIYGTRVTTGGAVLDPAGIMISQASNGQRCPDVAFDGTNFLVAWEDDRSGLDSTDIYGARVATDGEVLDPSGFAISQAANGQHTPAAGFDGTNFLLAWADGRDINYSSIYAARVTPSGAVLDQGGIEIAWGQGARAAPAVAFGGGNFLVAWQDYRRGQYDIYGSRVTPDGMALNNFAISLAATMQVLPALGFDGENFLVVWQDGRNGDYDLDVYGARVTPTGHVLDGDGIAISQSLDWRQFSPALGFGGTNFLVAWHDSRNSQFEPDIYGARVTTDGTVVDTSGFVVAQSARGQYSPATAFDGTNFLAVWEDDRNGYTDIYGARVTPSGTVLDPTGIAIAQAQEWQYEPAIAFDGANFLAVWQDYRSNPDDPDIYGARVALDGTVLDPGGIVISDAPNRQGQPALAFDGANYLVTWQDFRNGSYDIYGTRVTPAGTVLDPAGIAVAVVPNRQGNPGLGFDGTNSLVVWEDDHSKPGLPDIYGTRVTRSGTVLDPDGIAITRASNGQHNPALDFDGTNFLVVWDDDRSSAWPDIYGARVTTGGTVLDTGSIAISRGSKDQFAPAVAFDGTNFLVVYEDYRGSNNPDIYGAWVSPAGTVSDEGSVLRPAGNQTCLALARGSGSLLFMAFQGWAGIVGGNTYNTDRIWGEMNPTPGGGIEETMNDELVAMNVGTTIVRGVLVLGAVGSRQNAGYRAELLDAAGRKVMDLKPGANDVRALVPGVYFVRAEPSAVDRQPSAVAKVVVTR